MAYVIKNWEKHQHYKSGRGAPPWIKLYRDLLNDPEWFSLDPRAAKFLISVWILAAETNGILPASNVLAFRLRLASKEVELFISLCKEWIINDASNLLAICLQDASTETETETETYIKTIPPKTVGFCFKTELKNLGADPDLIADWLAVRKTKKAANTKTAFNAFVREVGLAKYTINQALNVCCEKSWQGFKAEWVKDLKPEQKPQSTFDKSAYEAKRKAELAIARENYRMQEEAESVPVQRT